MFNGKGNREVVAIGFTAGFVGGVAVLLAVRLVFAAGIGPALGGRGAWRSPADGAALSSRGRDNPAAPAVILGSERTSARPGSIR